jgi:aminoglycoside phosphotransferase (APT) family kinase protein
MVLEDLGEATAQPERPEHRAALLSSLGHLHAAGLRLATRLPAGHPLPRFSPESAEYAQWRGLLARPVMFDGGREEAALPFLDGLLSRLVRQPVTLLHGDLDWSNVVLVEDGIALVDWEKVALGPAALDLGAIREHFASGDLACYRTAFVHASRQDLSDDGWRELLDLADGHDCLRWICHYLAKVEAGHDPGPEWRAAYYAPRLHRLHSLLQRRNEWT